jgi:hypothetical protein
MSSRDFNWLQPEWLLIVLQVRAGAVNHILQIDLFVHQNARIVHQTFRDTVHRFMFTCATLEHARFEHLKSSLLLTVNYEI